MKGKKVLKIVLIIIAIILVILLIYTIRNFTIISSLQNKIGEYINSSNFSIKSTNTQEDNILTMNYYKKDNREAVFLEKDNNGEETKVSMYNNGQRIDTFTQTKDVKTVKLNSLNDMSVQIADVLKTDSRFQTFMYSMMAKVKKVNLNGKECYRIENYFSPYMLNGTEKNEIYIEKDTGLLVKQVVDNTTIEREYEFNNVDNSIFVEPDVSEYTLEE